MSTIDFEQTNIFDYLSHNSDPIYQELKKVDKGEIISVSDYIVRINPYGYYEVESHKCHEQFSNFTCCYNFITESIDEEQF